MTTELSFKQAVERVRGRDDLAAIAAEVRAGLATVVERATKA